MTEGRAQQQFHTDEVSLPKYGWYFWLDEANFQPIRSICQIWVATHHHYLWASPVSRGKQWWPRKMSEKFLRKQSEQGTMLTPANANLSHVNGYLEVTKSVETYTAVYKSLRFLTGWNNIQVWTECILKRPQTSGPRSGAVRAVMNTRWPLLKKFDCSMWR